MRGCLYIVYPNKILHEIYLISSVDKDEILLIFIQSSRQYCCSIRVATSKKSADKRSVVTRRFAPRYGENTNLFSRNNAYNEQHPQPSKRIKSRQMLVEFQLQILSLLPHPLATPSSYLGHHPNIFESFAGVERG